MDNNEIINKLKNLTKDEIKNVKKYSLDGMETYVRVKSVYDGDTITIIFLLNDKLTCYNCRIQGVDTPEKKIKKSQPDRGREKFYAIKARDFVKEQVLDKTLRCKFHIFDKYGRLLLEIFNENDESITDLLIKNNYALAYGGATKDTFDWDEMDRLHGCDTKDL